MNNTEDRFNGTRKECVRNRGRGETLGFGSSEREMCLNQRPGFVVIRFDVI